VENFSSKNTTFGAKISHFLGKFEGKFKIVSGIFKRIIIFVASCTLIPQVTAPILSRVT